MGREMEKVFTNFASTVDSFVGVSNERRTGK